MDLELTDAEAAMLRTVLDRTLRDLRYEIVDTDRREYRQGLQEDEVVIRALLDRLGGPLPNPV